MKQVFIESTVLNATSVILVTWGEHLYVVFFVLDFQTCIVLVYCLMKTHIVIFIYYWYKTYDIKSADYYTR